MKKKNLFLICIWLTLSCSNQENTVNPELLAGKIKTLSFVTNDTSATTYTFQYDSLTGDLLSVWTNNKKYIQIHERIGDYVIIDYDNRAVFDSTAQGAIIKLKAYLNNANYIKKIVSVDTISHVESDLVNYYTTNNYLDSVVLTSPEIQGNAYNYQYRNGNAIASVRLSNSFLGTSYDSAFMFYSNHIIDNNYLYFQDYALGAGVFTIQPHIILGFNGYNAYKSNINLLDSVQHYTGYINQDYRSYTIYQYVFNANNQPLEIKMKNIIFYPSWFYYSKYIYTYY